MTWPIFSICTSRDNRSRKTQLALQSKQALRQARMCNIASFSIILCCLALCSSVFIMRWSQYLMEKGEIDLISEHLQSAIKEALGADPKYNEDVQKLTTDLRPSFDALPKDDYGDVNSRAARQLLNEYFSGLGFQVDGLTSRQMRRPSSKGIHESLLNVAILKQGQVEVVEALRIMADAGIGLTLQHIACLAKVIKKELLSQHHLSRFSRLMHAPFNSTFSEETTTGELDMDTVIDLYMENHGLETIVEDVLGNLNVVKQSHQANSSELALPDTDSLIPLKKKGLEAIIQSHELEEGMNATELVIRLTENLTNAFQQLYIANHCEMIMQKMISAAPKDTGRLRLGAFYNLTWNGSQNFAEPKKHLVAAGALDLSVAETFPRDKVLIANYMSSYLNCIRHSEHYSLCCPNRCAPLMRSIKSSVRSPASAPEPLLRVVASLSPPSVQGRHQIPAALADKLRRIADKHGGVVPLNGRLFAQWMHYTFPNECPYPQQAELFSSDTNDYKKQVGRRKQRLQALDVSEKQKQRVSSLRLQRGFDEPATALQSAVWEGGEVLPFQEEQVWQEVSSISHGGVRIAACAALVLAMLQIIWCMYRKAAYTDDLQKPFDEQVLHERANRKIEALRFVFKVELTCGKNQDGVMVGLGLKTAHDPAGGLAVEDVLPDGLMDLRNRAITDRKQPLVTTGDRLVSVNGKNSVESMRDELSKFPGNKVTLHFACEAAKVSPLIWTASLEREGDEPWGISINSTDICHQYQASKELSISRVIPGGLVDKWNRRAARKNQCGLYPADIIIACDSEVDVKKIVAKLQKRHKTTLELTVLRWHAAVPEELKKNTAKVPRKNSSNASEATTATLTDNKSVEAQHTEVLGREAKELCQRVEDRQCECCGTDISDKYVLMCCSKGCEKYFKRTCWRNKYGGFTVEHMPRHCPCSSPLSKVEVYERSGKDLEARLVHTILDGPMEVDIKLDEAPDNGERERPAVTRRRAASATRRASEGEERTLRRRLPQVELNDNAGPDAESDVKHTKADSFFKPKKESMQKAVSVAQAKSASVQDDTQKLAKKEAVVTSSAASSVVSAGHPLLKGNITNAESFFKPKESMPKATSLPEAKSVGVQDDSQKLAKKETVVASFAASSVVSATCRPEGHHETCTPNQVLPTKKASSMKPKEMQKDAILETPAPMPAAVVPEVKAKANTTRQAPKSEAASAGMQVQQRPCSPGLRPQPKPKAAQATTIARERVDKHDALKLVISKIESNALHTKMKTPPPGVVVGGVPSQASDTSSASCRPPHVKAPPSGLMVRGAPTQASDTSSASCRPPHVKAPPSGLVVNGVPTQASDTSSASCHPPHVKAPPPVKAPPAVKAPLPRQGTRPLAQAPIAPPPPPLPSRGRVVGGLFQSASDLKVSGLEAAPPCLPSVVSVHEALSHETAGLGLGPPPPPVFPPPPPPHLASHEDEAPAQVEECRWRQAELMRAACDAAQKDALEIQNALENDEPFWDPTSDPTWIPQTASRWKTTPAPPGRKTTKSPLSLPASSAGPINLTEVISAYGLPQPDLQSANMDFPTGFVMSAPKKRREFVD